MFFETKFSKKLKNLQMKNVKDEISFNNIKLEYINHFYNYEELKENNHLFVQNDQKQSINSQEISEFDSKIPTLVELKLSLIKNRLMFNSLGQQEFFKIIDVVKLYESASLDETNQLKAYSVNYIDEKTDENKNFIKTLFECDEIRDLGNDEVECVVEGQKYHGFRLSNI